jgi:ATP-binding cassette subfamily F protein uup
VFIQPGNYSYYIEKRKERDAIIAARQTKWSPALTKAAKPEPVAEPKSTRPRKLSFKEQRELEGMEAAILAAETRVHELEATLNNANFYATRAAEAPKLIADLEAARAEVVRLYTRWEELAAIPR